MGHPCYCEYNKGQGISLPPSRVVKAPTNNPKNAYNELKNKDDNMAN